MGFYDDLISDIKKTFENEKKRPCDELPPIITWMQYKKEFCDPEPKEFEKDGVMSKVPEFSCTEGWKLNKKENIIEKIDCKVEEKKESLCNDPIPFGKQLNAISEAAKAVHLALMLKNEINRISEMKSELKTIKAIVTKDLTIGEEITEVELSGKKVKLQNAGIQRTITVMVISIGNKLYSGYSILNPCDKFDLEKAKMICEGRAMNDRTNLLKGHNLGTITGKYINKAIAHGLLRKIEQGEIKLKGLNNH